MADSTVSEGGVTPKLEWTKRSEKRSAWIRPEIQHGERVLPPNEQKSNIHLADSEVLQPRMEPVGESVAFPLNVGQDRPTGGITAPRDGGGAESFN